jgi:FlaA1/EpsC-like NDP-sugar epimerase
MIELSGLTVRDAENPEGDIELAVMGLRPGEKLYEELLIGDNPETTEHPRIMKAREDFLFWPELSRRLKVLDSTLDRNDMKAARAMLAELVSGYSSTDDVADMAMSAAEANTTA